VSDEERERERDLRSSSATWREDRIVYPRTRADVARDVEEFRATDKPPPPPLIVKLADRTLTPRDILRGEAKAVIVPLRRRMHEFTRAQAEALYLTYVVGLTQKEAAAVTRYQPCSRESYGKRLRRAEKHAVAILRDKARLPQADGVVRRGRNRGRR
jgi:DNA-directed RNA polymerase specialized sigma24 family protein